MWTKEIEDCLSKLTKEEERVLKRTILKGGFGDDSCSFRNILGGISKQETRCFVYLTNCWLDSLAMLGVLMLLRNG